MSDKEAPHNPSPPPLKEVKEEDEDSNYCISPMEAAINNFKAKMKYFHYLPVSTHKLFIDWPENAEFHLPPH